MNIGIGSCCGTFGELVQGVIDGAPFLITLPVPVLNSQAYFIKERKSKMIKGSSSHSKAAMACQRFFLMNNIRAGGKLIIKSNIPVGKGLASSSADLVAAIRAAADAYKIPLTSEVISLITSEIEPTDGVMYEEVVAYNYLEGQLKEKFRPMPPFHLIGVDLGGMIDTIEFNKTPKLYSVNELEEFKKAYDLIKKGLLTQDLSLICSAASISARINQQRLPKKYFCEFESLAARYHGGIVVAHSGTVIGMLINPSYSEEDLTNIKQHIKELTDKPDMPCFSYSHSQD